ncbi:MAG: hypothetical protein ACE5JZ_13570, partial [Kiloniellales bacterium]
ALGHHAQHVALLVLGFFLSGLLSIGYELVWMRSVVFSMGAFTYVFSSILSVYLLGNVIGANMFNILGVMGVVSLATPLAVPEKIVGYDLWVMLGVTVLFVAWMMFACRLGRPLALLFLAAYGAYIAVQYLGLSGVAANAG